jgi:5-methylcytosine-specific restriction endonuclease McrA
MALKHIKRLLIGPARPVTREEAMKVFKRDHYVCQYCGLDGLHSFENWLILTVDFIHPRVRGGARSMDNLVTACQPCNLVKGKYVYSTFEHAKKHVLAKREEWHKFYESQVKSVRSSAA